jgi:hypothetical protein
VIKQRASLMGFSSPAQIAEPGLEEFIEVHACYPGTCELIDLAPAESWSRHSVTATRRARVRERGDRSKPGF